MADKKARQTKRQTKAKAKANGAKGGRPSKARGVPNSSDAGDARWTIRGVPANVRDIAVKAAQSRGMTVGDWLAEAIVASDRKRVSADSKSTAVAMPQEKIIDMMETMNRRLTEMEQRHHQSFWGRLFGRRNGGHETITMPDREAFVQ